MEDIKNLENLKGSDLRKAKEILAFEVTRLAHGPSDTETAMNASRSLFGGGSKVHSAAPSIILERASLAQGICVMDLFLLVGLATSKSAVKRLIEQGGAYLNDRRVTSSEVIVTEADAKDGFLLLRQGKKNYRQVVLR